MTRHNLVGNGRISFRVISPYVSQFQVKGETVGIEVLVGSEGVCPPVPPLQNPDRMGGMARYHLVVNGRISFRVISPYVSQFQVKGETDGIEIFGVWQKY